MDRDYWDSVRRLKLENNLSDEDVQEAVKLTSGARYKKYFPKLFKKYSTPLIGRAIEWAQGNLSESEREEINPEEMVILYMQHNPGECSSEELAYALGRDKVKPLLRDPHTDPIVEERFGYNEGGELEESPPPKKERKPVEISRAEMETMPLDKLKAKIGEARRSLEGDEL